MAGLLGNIFSAFGKNQAPDIQSRPLSQEAETLYNSLFKDYGKVGSAAQGDLGKFREQFTALTPQLSALDQSHSALYGDLLKQAGSYDPTKNFRASGDYLFGNLDRYLDRGMKAGTAAMNSALARLGYGDRGPGAFNTILNSDRITGNLLPAFNNIVSNLTPLSTAQNNAYFQNLSQIPGWAQAQSESLMATPYRALVPIQMERANLMANLNSLNQINAGNLSNRFFYEKPNWMTTAGDVASGVYQSIGDGLDLVNKAASTYGNVMGAGMMGGGQPQNQPDLSGGSNLSTGQFPGEYVPQVGSPVVGLPQYNPSSSLYSQFYQPPNYAAQYGYAPQNPYAQFGGYF